MSEQDRQKWDEKYRKKNELLEPREASAVVKRHCGRGKGLRALDLACGAGRNTFYLAREGFEVDAVDVAQAAIDALSVEALRQGLAEYISPIVQDLDTLETAPEQYDLIVMSNFLDRVLIERTKEGLKRGGTYIVETYMVDDANEKQGSDRSNLLEAEELKSIFSTGYEVLFYDEFENEPYELYRMKKQAIVARKK